MTKTANDLSTPGSGPPAGRTPWCGTTDGLYVCKKPRGHEGECEGRRAYDPSAATAGSEGKCDHGHDGPCDSQCPCLCVRSDTPPVREALSTNFLAVQRYEDGCLKATWVNFHENGHQHVCVCGHYNPHEQCCSKWPFCSQHQPVVGQLAAKDAEIRSLREELEKAVKSWKVTHQECEKAEEALAAANDKAAALEETVRRQKERAGEIAIRMIALDDSTVMQVTPLRRLIDKLFALAPPNAAAREGEE